MGKDNRKGKENITIRNDDMEEEHYSSEDYDRIITLNELWVTEQGFCDDIVDEDDEDEDGFD